MNPDHGSDHDVYANFQELFPEGRWPEVYRCSCLDGTANRQCRLHPYGAVPIKRLCGDIGNLLQPHRWPPGL